ncbi:AAA family ATPase [Orenia marismortui]|uniref:Nuclease SbcCD subunit C n=1 Tax=Orenia marismortui TaxID=46469 RepID=A0A4R8H2S1_9FIRM|nr:AAA family ATPase [Orenia marismortui]TDX52910.1 exonuclease SbcC [Orenia marismortui]
MRIIERMEIINFQSHEHTILEFDKGLNVITGPSDQGKSAIIRALRWVLYNEPRGTDFIRHNQSDCQVAIELDNKFKIIRKRTPSKNRYILVNPEGEEHVFERVGSGVPEEIIKVHGMPKIDLDTDNETTLNIDYQLEGAFLLTDSGSVRAKTLGRLINVHIVDSAIRRTKTDISRLNMRNKQLKEELEINREKLKEFDNLDDLKKDIKSKETILDNLRTYNQKLESLISLQEKLNQSDDRMNKYSDLLDQLNDLEKIEDIYQRLDDRSIKFENIVELVKKEEVIRKRFVKLEDVIGQLSDLDQINLLYKDLNNRYQKLDLGIKLLNKYKDNKSRINLGKNILTELNKVDHGLDYFSQAKKIEDNFSKLNGFDIKWNKIKDDILINGKILDQTSGVKDVKFILKEKLPELEKKIEEIIYINNKIEDLEKSINKKEIILNKLPSDDQIVNIQQSLEKRYNQLSDLKEVQVGLNKNKESINKGKVYMKKLDKNIETLAAQYSQVLKKIGKCPTCFESIDNHTVDKIIKELKGE